MRLTADNMRIGPAGVAVSAAAGGTIVAAIGIAPGSATGLVVLWAVTLALVLALTRVDLPNPLRLLLIATLFGTAAGLSISGDPLTANATATRVEQRVAEIQTARALAAAAAEGPASARRGASVVLTGSAFATRMTRELDGTLGGPGAGALAIRGTTRPGDAADRIALFWSIGEPDRRIDCGTVTVSGGGEAAMIGAIRDSFGRAIVASLAGNGLRCA